MSSHAAQLCPIMAITAQRAHCSPTGGRNTINLAMLVLPATNTDWHGAKHDAAIFHAFPAREPFPRNLLLCHIPCKGAHAKDV
eukprot:scaffold38309_cov23-Prasinocladus_malaysianus.AAC.1